MRTILLLLMLVPALEARPKPVVGLQAKAVAARSKARRRANPVRFLRRLGAAEVNLAMRVSFWGIPAE